MRRSRLEGHLGTLTSSENFKDAIKPTEKASETILSLRSITFRYIKELDPQKHPAVWLGCRAVEKVNPDLVARNEQGRPYAVRYEAVNAMLLNAFLKEHRKVEEQSSQMTKQDRKVQELEASVGQSKSTVAQQKDLQATVAPQQQEIETLTANLKQQASQIHKVSDQLEVRKAARRLVVNDQ